MGVGRREEAPLDFEIWCFPIDFLVEKYILLFLSR